MKNLTDQIKELKINIKNNFELNLEKEYELILSNLPTSKRKLLKSDFQFLLTKGKNSVINSFAGGILFLKVPERIEKITIEALSDKNTLNASVIFESNQREKENIKYKPDSGKVASVKWSDKNIMPNFFLYKKEIQGTLLTIIGKIVKWICEYGSKNFAYMKIENEFEIQLLIDQKIVSILKTELD